MSYEVGIDIGGTFTDLIAIDRNLGEVKVGKAASRPGNPIGEIEIKQKVLPKRFSRRNAVAANNLAQRGEAIGGRHIALSLIAISRASFRAAIKLAGRAFPLAAISNAVP